MAGLIASILGACGRSTPDIDRLNEIVRGIDGVSGSDLRIAKTGSGGRLLRGTVQLPDDEESAKRVFNEVLKALSKEIGGDRGTGLSIYVYGEYGGGELDTSDVGAPLNPGSYGLWQHYYG